MENFDQNITPKPEEYANAIDFLIREIKKGFNNKRWKNRKNYRVIKNGLLGK
ncbi:MAG: hypothetical protein QXO71_09755 [Candidatus Jordarchaeaceae archaeon]